MYVTCMIFFDVYYKHILYICVYICTIFSSMPVPLNISAINRANSLSDASASSCSRTNTLKHSYLHCDIHSLQHEATHCNKLQHTTLCKIHVPAAQHSCLRL